MLFFVRYASSYERKYMQVSEENAKAFRAEILLTATLKHANIVGFVGACWSRELVALLLEWVPKGSLEDLLSLTSIRLEWNDPLLRLASDIARGMAYLHSRSYFDERSRTQVDCILHR
jgi:serine/threonine protein kinase